MPPVIAIAPDDAHNARLVKNVHPPDWQNPRPSGRYNLVVIGAGSAGLITSLVAAGLGAKVALIERHLMGGDCLNVGCVPSKAVIRSARRVVEARSARALGLETPDAPPDFARAMERMREIRARISSEDAAARYRDEFGVDIYLGDARFVDEQHIEVAGARLEFAKAVIASGARPALPPIPGLAESGALDNETVFTLTERPARLAVIGAGPIGCELAQAFQRLGSQVTLLANTKQILPREDPDAARLVSDALVQDGVELLLDCAIEKVERGAGDLKTLRITGADGATRALAVDKILVGAGRAPNVEGLGLETVKVDFDPVTGIKVDDFLRTTNPRIYAAGDCCMQWKFTHAADAAAKLVVQNALFSLGPLGRRRLSQLVMPWCTYTDPEIAHVGLYEHDARAQGIAFDRYEVPIAAANRAVTDGEERGLVKVLVKRGSDRILGATVVASHAGELITQLTLAIGAGIGLGRFTGLIYPYPTQGEAIKRAAGAYTRTRLTARIARLFEMLMTIRRRLRF